MIVPKEVPRRRSTIDTREWREGTSGKLAQCSGSRLNNALPDVCLLTLLGRVCLTIKFAPGIRENEPRKAKPEKNNRKRSLRWVNGIE